MGTAVKLSDAIVKDLKVEATRKTRSMTGQAEHWIKIGRAIEAAPDFNFEKVADALEGDVDIDTLSDDEKEVYFEHFYEAMRDPSQSPEAQEFFADRRAKGLGVGMNEDGEIIEQTAE